MLYEIANPPAAPTCLSLQTLARGQPSLHRLSDREFDLFGAGSRFRGVQNGAGRGGQADPFVPGDIRLRERPCRGMDSHAREPGQIPFRAGNGQVHRLGDDVAKVEQVQGALVRNDRAVLAYRQPSRDDLLPIRGWVVAQTVDATAKADEATVLGVVGDEVRLEPAGTGLLAREEPLLSGGDPEEARLIGRLRSYVIHKLNNTELMDDIRLGGWPDLRRS